MNDPDPLPKTEAPPVPPTKTSVEPAAAAEPKGVAGFVVVQVIGTVVCLGTIAVLESNNGSHAMWLLALVYGIMFAKIAMAAAATAFGPWNLLLRLTVPALWPAVETLLLVAMISQGSVSEPLLVAGLIVFLWMAIQIPLWGLRRALRLRLLKPNWSQDIGHALHDQFSIGQMLIFTLVLAIVLGLGRAVFSAADLRSFFNLPIEVAAVFALLSAASSALVFITFYCGLRSGPPAVALCVAGLMAVVVVIGVILGYSLLIPRPYEKMIFAMVVVIQFLWLLPSTLVLRRSGWRLLSLAR